MYRKDSEGWQKHADFIVLDMICLQLAYVLAYAISGYGFNPYATIIYRNMAVFLELADLVVIFGYGTMKSVLKRGYYRNFIVTLNHCIMVGALAILYLFLLQEGQLFSRLTLILTIVIYLGLTYLARELWKKLLRKQMEDGGERKLLIITSKDVAEKVVLNMQENNYARFTIAGAAVIDADWTGREIHGVPVVADEEAAPMYVCQEWIDEVLIVISEEHPYPADLISKLTETGVTVHLNLAKITNVPGKKQFVEKVGNYTVLTTSINYASTRQLMLKRLMETAAQEGLSFGVKLTNTFPVDIKRQELPGEEMYMSGKALFPLSISVASRLAESFDGKLPMSFSGGADQKNIDQIVDCGIWPVTVATVLLKPGGYKWMTKIAEKADSCEIGKCGEVQVETLKKLAEDSLTDAHYRKTGRKAAGKRTEEKSPLLDCLKKNGVGEKKEFTGHKRVCGNCADVCPNRANVLIEVPEMELLQILHVDYMCNECGNCRSFCQYAGAPYKDKFTLFATEEDMEDSTNNGFTVLDAETKEVLVRIGDRQEKVKADQPSEMLSEDLSKLMCTVIDDYTYLLM